MSRVAVRFWRWPRRKRSADIRSDLGQASNAGQRRKRRNPPGARQKGRLAASLARYSPLKRMRLTRSFPFARSASTRAPSQYFKSLLGLAMLLWTASVAPAQWQPEVRRARAVDEAPGPRALPAENSIERTLRSLEQERSE